MRIGKKLSAVLVSALMLVGVAARGGVASASPAHQRTYTTGTKPKPRPKPAGGTPYEQQLARLPATFTRQRLTWTPCGAKVSAAVKGFWAGTRCALLTAPLDYAKPSGQTIKIAIDEILSTPGKKKLGVLMTNPGGPGGAGLDMAPFLANGKYSPDALHDSYDIVGMNPRGIGPSTDGSGPRAPKNMGAGATTLTCATGDISYRPPVLPRWASPELRTMADNAAVQEASCQQTANGIRRYITTMNTARDMDLLRIVLRTNKVNYYGVSYGTFLGAVYGAMFPASLNRMVLDGSMSPVTSWYNESPTENNIKVLNFQAFASWAVANHQGLGGTPTAVRATLDSLYSDVQRSAPAALGGYTPAKLSKDIGEFTRYRPDWVKFAASLRNALAADSGGQVNPALSQDVTNASALVPAPSDINPQGEDDPNMSDAVYSAVTCDWPWPKPDDAGYRAYNDNILHWKNTFQYAGTMSSVGPSACTYLSYRPLERLPVIKSRGAYPKGLVVNTDGDTQTSLTVAKEMAKVLGFDLITITNDGTHGSSFKGNTCVDNAVARYLVRGTLPGSITCATINPPGTGNESLTNAAASADQSESTGQ